MKTNTLTPDLLQRMDAYWRAANYLSVGQIYLFDNPLLKRPLTLADVKHMLLGHWGTTPGQNFIYVHLNRVIKKYDLDMIYVSGPGPSARTLPSGVSTGVEQTVANHRPRAAWIWHCSSQLSRTHLWHWPRLRTAAGASRSCRRPLPPPGQSCQRSCRRR
jgi:hypothetical protein